MVKVTKEAPNACSHKGEFALDAICALDEGCADHLGAPYQLRYGQPEAYQDGVDFEHDGVERATDKCNENDPSVVPCGYNLRFSTGGKGNYPDGKYKEAGPMTVCVSLPPLDKYRCQDGVMGDNGLMRNFGQNDQGYDLAKK